MRSGEILIDQGSSDNFLDDQLKPELFNAACEKTGQKLTLRYQAGYDSSTSSVAIRDSAGYKADEDQRDSIDGEVGADVAKIPLGRIDR